jgi:hypothetical protein
VVQKLGYKDNSELRGSWDLDECRKVEDVDGTWHVGVGPGVLTFPEVAGFVPNDRLVGSSQ